MATNVDEIIKKLRPAERKKVEARAATLASTVFRSVESKRSLRFRGAKRFLVIFTQGELAAMGAAAFPDRAPVVL